MAVAHLVFVPLMAQGHLIPAVDTALLLATHGALCTIVATPATVARVCTHRRLGPAVRLEAVLEEKSGELAFPRMRQVFMLNNTNAIVRRAVRSNLAMFLPPGWARAREEHNEEAASIDNDKVCRSTF
uniref:Exocyst complex subunit Exo70 C-terminal domain-containing protein n=1 Tax=Oryza rufipogon TaxID=4529 RepID=A0A0E0RGQ2_ORYRU